MIVLAGYVMSLGQWVGAADEKFNDAETVETRQNALLIQQNTLAVRQQAIEAGVQENKEAIEKSKQEILDAISKAHEDDE